MLKVNQSTSGAAVDSSFGGRKASGLVPPEHGPFDVEFLRPQTVYGEASKAGGKIMKAIWHGQVIAESDRTIEVDGYRYFPLECVRVEPLRAAPESPSDLACPNVVQFYDVALDASLTDPPGPTKRHAPRWAMSIVGLGSGRTSRSFDLVPRKMQELRTGDKA